MRNWVHRISKYVLDSKGKQSFSSWHKFDALGPATDLLQPFHSIHQNQRWRCKGTHRRRKSPYHEYQIRCHGESEEFRSTRNNMPGVRRALRWHKKWLLASSIIIEKWLCFYMLDQSAKRGQNLEDDTTSSSFHSKRLRKPLTSIVDSQAEVIKEQLTYNS